MLMLIEAACTISFRYFELFVRWLCFRNHFSFLVLKQEKNSCSTAFVFSVIQTIIAHFSFFEICNTKEVQAYPFYFGIMQLLKTEIFGAWVHCILRQPVLLLWLAQNMSLSSIRDKTNLSIYQVLKDRELQPAVDWMAH